MQPSQSMKLSSSVFGDVALPTKNMELQSNGPEKISRMSKSSLAMVVIICIVAILGLFASAFTALPGAEASVDCVDCVVSVVSESSLTLLCFALGWMGCFVLKRLDDMARLMCKIGCSAKQLSYFVYSRAFSVALLARRVGSLISKKNAQIAGMVLVAALMISCILGLFISAFTAVPDMEENPSDGFASESSSSIRIFTAGWMFVLSLKLRRELIGLAGSSCLLQPW